MLGHESTLEPVSESQLQERVQAQILQNFPQIELKVQPPDPELPDHNNLIARYGHDPILSSFINRFYELLRRPTIEYHDEQGGPLNLTPRELETYIEHVERKIYDSFSDKLEKDAVATFFKNSRLRANTLTNLSSYYQTLAGMYPETVRGVTPPESPRTTYKSLRRSEKIKFVDGWFGVAKQILLNLAQPVTQS